MVKGTKQKIAIEKITKKNSLATCFTKRREGLYSKASQLCLLSGAQIAVLATPSSSQSNVSFFSFGHSSVDSVVSAYLTGHRPVPVPEESKQMREDIGICLARKDLGLGFWWDDESLNRSENPEELKDAIDSVSSMLKKLKNNDIGGTQEMNQTLNVQSNFNFIIPDDVVLEDNCLETDTDKLMGFENKEELEEFTASPMMNSKTAVVDDFSTTKEEQSSFIIPILKNNDIGTGTQEMNQTLNVQSSFIIPDEKQNLDDQEMDDLEKLIDFDGLFSDDDGVFDNIEELEEFAASPMKNSETAVVDDFSTTTEEQSVSSMLKKLKSNDIGTGTQEMNQTLNVQSNFIIPDSPVENIEEQNLDELEKLIDFDGLLSDDDGVFDNMQELEEFAASFMMNSEAFVDDFSMDSC